MAWNDLLELAGVETRGIEQDLLPRLFYVASRNGNVMETQQKLHIGHMVKSVFDKSGLSVAEFARRIHCERTNVYKIFNRQSIDVEILVKISEALEHNFLADVMKHYGLSAKYSTNLSFNITLEDLTRENVDSISKFLATFRNTNK